MADAHLLNAVPELATDPVWLSLDAVVGTSMEIGGTLLTDDAIPETLVVVAGAGTTSVLCNRDDAGDFGSSGTPAHLPGVGVTYTPPAAGGTPGISPVLAVSRTVSASGASNADARIIADTSAGTGQAQAGTRAISVDGGSSHNIHSAEIPDAGGIALAAVEAYRGDLDRFYGFEARAGGGSEGVYITDGNDSQGAAGDVLAGGGAAGKASWQAIGAVLIAGGNQAAHVANGSTVDQLRDALVAAGLMAAS